MAFAQDPTSATAPAATAVPGTTATLAAGTSPATVFVPDSSSSGTLATGANETPAMSKEDELAVLEGKARQLFASSDYKTLPDVMQRMQDLSPNNDICALYRQMLDQMKKAEAAGKGPVKSVFARMRSEVLSSPVAAKTPKEKAKSASMVVTPLPTSAAASVTPAPRPVSAAPAAAPANSTAAALPAASVTTPAQPMPAAQSEPETPSGLAGLSTGLLIGFAVALLAVLAGAIIVLRKISARKSAEMELALTADNEVEEPKANVQLKDLVVRVDAKNEPDTAYPIYKEPFAGEGANEPSGKQSAKSSFETEFFESEPMSFGPAASEPKKPEIKMDIEKRVPRDEPDEEPLELAIDDEQYDPTKLFDQAIEVVENDAMPPIDLGLGGPKIETPRDSQVQDLTGTSFGQQFHDVLFSGKEGNVNPDGDERKKPASFDDSFFDSSGATMTQAEKTLSDDDPPFDLLDKNTLFNSGRDTMTSDLNLNLFDLDSRDAGNPNDMNAPKNGTVEQRDDTFILEQPETLARMGMEEPSQGAPMSEEQREHVFQLQYRKGCEAFEKQDFAAAYQHFSVASALHPDDPEVSQRMNLVKQSLRK